TKTARHGVPHDRGPFKFKISRYVHDVGKERIQRIVLVFAPPRVPEATVVKNDDLTVVSQSRSNPDPVVRVEVVASMQDYNGRFASRAALRPKSPVKERNISRLDFSCLMQQLIHGRCPLIAIQHCGGMFDLMSVTRSARR